MEKEITIESEGNKTEISVIESTESAKVKELAENDIHREHNKSAKGTRDENTDMQSAEGSDVCEDYTEGKEETEEIGDKEAESRFMLWYNDICSERFAMLESEEWYKRRIKELENVEEQHKQRISELKENKNKLIQKLADAQLEIKLLRKKNQSTEDDREFTDSYKALSIERDRLYQKDRDNCDTIKCLRKEIHNLRMRSNMRYALKNRINKTETSREGIIKRRQVLDVARPSNYQSKEQVKAENVEKFTLPSKCENENSASEKTLIDSYVKKSSLSLPDIRTRSGYKVWRN